MARSHHPIIVPTNRTLTAVKLQADSRDIDRIQARQSWRRNSLRVMLSSVVGIGVYMLTGDVYWAVLPLSFGIGWVCRPRHSRWAGF